MGNALGVLKVFPSAVHEEVGHALYMAQRREKNISAKPLKGVGPGVLETVSDHRGGTFRAVYTVRLGDRVYVLHALQRKSKRGIATPQAEVDVIRRRLKVAQAISEEQE